MIDGWRYKRVKDIVISTNSGSTPSSNNSSYYEVGNVPWINTGDLCDGPVVSNKQNITEYALLNYPILKYHPIGTLIIAMYGATIGKLGILTYPATVNQACCCLLLNEKIVNNKFLFYYLLNDKNSIISQSVGATQPNISQKIVLFYPIFLPPLSTQIAIADYLDKKTSQITSQIALLEKKRDTYSRLKKSLIHKVVTKGLNPDVELKDSGIDWLGKIPKHWGIKRVKDVGFMYSGLSGKTGEDFRNEDENTNKYFIPYTNILNNLYLDKSLVKPVMMADDEKQNRIEKGDLFFLMSSEDYESIGKTSVLNEDVNEIYLNSFCKGVRITDKGTFSPFMNYQLLSEKFRNGLRFEARGFTRINLKIDKVMSMPICLPPINEQKTIVSYLDFNLKKIDKAITIVNTQIAKSQTLRKSLINEVVTGERSIV